MCLKERESESEREREKEREREGERERERGGEGEGERNADIHRQSYAATQLKKNSVEEKNKISIKGKKSMADIHWQSNSIKEKLQKIKIKKLHC